MNENSTIQEGAIPAFSEQYHRSRRNLILVSALLLSWEFVGFELGASFNLPMVNFPVTVKNPQVVPFLLFIMVLFFWVRYLIEWGQTHIERRKNMFGRLDFIFSNILTVFALVLYMFQTSSGTEFAQLLTIDNNDKFGLSLFFGVVALIAGALFEKFVAMRFSRHSIAYYGGFIFSTLLLIVVWPMIVFFVWELELSASLQILFFPFLWAAGLVVFAATYHRLRPNKDAYWNNS